MNVRFSRGCSLILVLALSILGGCDGKPPVAKVYPVSGTVTLDGQALAEGTITFKTVATGGMDSMPVVNGKFAGNAEAGERRVEITAYKIKTGDYGGMGGGVPESLVHKRFNVESKLTAKVTEGGANQFTFEVSAK